MFIALLRPSGELLSEGTGFLVAGSGNGRGPRIVTAAHVVALDDTPGDTLLMVFSSDGTPIGTPRVVAGGPSRKVSLGGASLVVDDLAVLEIAQFTDPKIARHFATIEGLPIAHGGTLMVGETHQPIGAVWGFSGAAAVDGTGRVIGVLTEADFRGRVKLELGSIQETNVAGRPERRAVTLPVQSLIVVEPFTAPEVLTALNQTIDVSSTSAPTDAVIAGFPLGSCASTAATLQPADSPAAADVLRKWRQLGAAGAWYLPPQFSPTKLRLIP